MSDQFRSISLEKGGGMCVPMMPCWWRTSVSYLAEISLENSLMESMSATLTEQELASVVAIANRSDFRATIESKVRVCPVVFDEESIFELITTAKTFCQVTLTGMFNLLQSLSKEHFPDFAPSVAGI